MEVIASIVRSYCDSLLSAEQLGVTNQAMRSAEADLTRAEAHRTAGMSTDVDALSIRVHLAGVREQQIQRAADSDVARATLNDLLGLPLDSPHRLTTSLTPVVLPGDSPGEYETSRAADRPEARQTKLATRLAEN